MYKPLLKTRPELLNNDGERLELMAALLDLKRGYAKQGKTSTAANTAARLEMMDRYPTLSFTFAHFSLTLEETAHMYIADLAFDLDVFEFDLTALLTVEYLELLILAHLGARS